MIEVEYNGSIYKYDKSLGRRPWVGRDTNLAVPVVLYATLRKKAIESGTDPSVFTTNSHMNKDSKKKAKSKHIKIF